MSCSIRGHPGQYIAYDLYLRANILKNIRTSRYSYGPGLSSKEKTYDLYYIWGLLLKCGHETALATLLIFHKTIKHIFVKSEVNGHTNIPNVLWHVSTEKARRDAHYNHSA